MLKQEQLLQKADSQSFKNTNLAPVIHNQEPASNNYNKYLDIEHPLIDAAIQNLLLR